MPLGLCLWGNYSQVVLQGPFRGWVKAPGHAPTVPPPQHLQPRPAPRDVPVAGPDPCRLSARLLVSGVTMDHAASQQVRATDALYSIYGTHTLCMSAWKAVTSTANTVRLVCFSHFRFTVQHHLPVPGCWTAPVELLNIRSGCFGCKVHCHVSAWIHGQPHSHLHRNWMDHLRHLQALR